MIEIFTKSSGGSGKAERVLGESVNLKTPADVHFGTASPGIAFYEKAGADLRVTLLNGKVVTLQNFFAAGPNGEFSRLLVAENGAPEVTGLIAPEPFVARDDAPVLTTAAESGAAPAPEASPSESAFHAPAGAALDGDSGGDSAAAETAGGDGGGAGPFGVPLDLLAFGAANVGLLWAGLSSSDDSDAPAPPSAELDSEIAQLLSEAALPEDGLELLIGAPLTDLPAMDAPPIEEAPVAAASDEILFATDPAPLAGFDELFQPFSAI